MAQVVVVDPVFVAEREANYALPHQGLHAVLDQARVTGIAEAAGQPPRQANDPGGGAEQQRPGIRGEPTTSQAATTAPPSTRAKSNRVALPSVGTGELLCSPTRLCCRRTFADSAPRCTYSL